MSARRHLFVKTHSTILKSLLVQGAKLEVGVLTGIFLGIWIQAKTQWVIFGLALNLNRHHENLIFL